MSQPQPRNIRNNGNDTNNGNGNVKGKEKTGAWLTAPLQLR